MSLIQKIQEKGAWIIVVAIALALIAFIAMDSFSSGGGLFRNTTTLATVNGDDLDVKDFEAKVNQIQAMQGNNAAREDLITNVYNYEVRNLVMHQEYEKLGLGLADRELDSAMFGNNPPQFLAQMFTDPNTGAYDVTNAKNYIQQVRSAKNNPQVAQAAQMIEMSMQELGEQLMIQKYQSMLMGAANVPSWLVEKSVADANSIASISYVNIPYTTVSDSAIKISDEEIMTFVNKHKKQFEQKEGFRDISVVAFSAAANSADSAAQLAAAEKIRQDFANATDIESFVSLQNSSANYYDGYLSSKEIQDPLKDTIISQPIGGIVGPFVDNGSIVLAKLVAAQPIADTVSAKYILVATHAPGQDNQQQVQVRDDSAALRRADTAAALVRSGVSFDSVLVRYSDNPQNYELKDITSSGLMQMGLPELSDFLLTSSVGAIKTVKVPGGYLMSVITERKGSSTGYKIARIIKPLSPSSETISAANSAANQFAAQSRDAKSFDANAAKQNLQIVPVQGIRENDYAIGNFGSDRGLVRWINGAKVGDVSEPMQIGDQVLVARLNSIVKKGMPTAANVRPFVEAYLKNEKKAKVIIDTKMKGNTLEAIAQAAGVQVSRADSISFYGQLVPGLGMEPKVVGAAFNKSIQGKVSKPIAGNMGVFAIKGEGVSATPSASAEQIKQTLLQSWMQQMFQVSTNALIEAADIKDRRSTFY